MSSNKLIVERSELQELRLFHSVDLSQVEDVLVNCSLKEFQAGEIIIHAGQINKCVYLLLSGSVRIHLDNMDEEPLIAYEAGESLGEISAIDHKTTTANVVAESACRTLVLDENTLMALVKVSHMVAVNLLNILAERLRYDATYITRTNMLRRKYEQFATVDSLTGLYNRRWLEVMLPRYIDECRIEEKPFSLIMLDIDHFKQFNDTYGHIAGDRGLYTLALTLLQHLRKSDLVARYGGEEFIVLMPGFDLEEARLVAERLRVAVSEASVILSSGRPLPALTISLGLAQSVNDQTPEGLVGVADAALYRAKHNGRNCVSD